MDALWLVLEEIVMPLSWCIRQLGEEGMMFDPYMNDVWAARNAALDQFIQAVRKVRIWFPLLL